MIKQKNPGTRRGSFALYGNSEDDIVPQHDDLRGSSTVARAPPYYANPNSIFFVKHCFGFVFVLEDVDQSTSSFFGAS
jgi:hypothetical protein